MRRSAFFGLGILSSLLFLGIGCFGFGAKEVVNESLKPITVPVEALNKAQQVTEEDLARQREAAAMASDEITVALILLADEPAPAGAEVRPGTIGCGDSVAFVEVPRKSSTQDVVRDALTTLFAYKEQRVEGLYNALYQSDLLVEKVVIGKDGVTTEVWISGQSISGGVCDDPRIKDQIESTIARFRPKYKIFLNATEANWRCLGDQSGLCE